MTLRVVIVWIAGEAGSVTPYRIQRIHVGPNEEPEQAFVVEWSSRNQPKSFADGIAASVPVRSALGERGNGMAELRAALRHEEDGLGSF